MRRRVEESKEEEEEEEEEERVLPVKTLNPSATVNTERDGAEIPREAVPLLVARRGAQVSGLTERMTKAPDRTAVLVARGGAPRILKYPGL